MAKTYTWVDDFNFGCVCPRTNKIFKTYEGLVPIANELHTDVLCTECKGYHLLTEDIIVLLKR